MHKNAFSSANIKNYISQSKSYVTKKSNPHLISMTQFLLDYQHIEPIVHFIFFLNTLLAELKHNYQLDQETHPYYALRYICTKTFLQVIFVFHSVFPHGINQKIKLLYKHYERKLP